MGCRHMFAGYEDTGSKEPRIVSYLRNHNRAPGVLGLAATSMRKRNQFCPTGVGRCDFRFAHQAASARKRRSQCRRRWSSAQESGCVSRFLLPAFQHSRQAPVLRPLILLAMATVVLPHSHWQSHRTRPFAALFSARRITVSLPKRRPVKSWNLGIAEPLANQLAVLEVEN
jgi:hypothetical protein